MMIKKVKMKRFKRFKDRTIELNHGVSLLAGGNNAGKSSLLHALAIWEFCKKIITIEKSKDLFYSTTGVGVSFEDFTPLNIPSFKHLWTNLKSQKVDGDEDGFTLRICVYWDIEEDECFLEFGLSLANDRLFIKPTSTNLPRENTIPIPTVGYLPPFAGITDKEPKYTLPMRNRLIGNGLAGSVIRNIILEMFEKNQEKRKGLKGNKAKILSSDLKKLRKTDSYEILISVIQDVFETGIRVKPFNDQYHTYIQVESFKGKYNERGIFTKFTDYHPRDIMVEGSGFLQWLSVYALALSEEIDIILLDEPDAHLHPSLQSELIGRLNFIAQEKNKQILFATHSSEIIKETPVESILRIHGGDAKYLNDETQKVKLLSGIGTIYSPKIHALQNKKNMLIVESEFDERMLKIWMKRFGKNWPENLLTWYWPSGQKERTHLYKELKKEIPELQAISIRDRDDEPLNTVDTTLLDKMHPEPVSGLKKMKWRRRYIENYLLDLRTIARASDKPIENIRVYFQQNHALSIPDEPNLSNVANAIKDARSKEFFIEGSNSLKALFSITREDIANAMTNDELPEDVITLLNEILNMCDTD